jgi:hypothetical protein
MDWLILILGVPAILIPLVLLFGFAGCASAGFCTDDSDCTGGMQCIDGSCFAVGEPNPPPPPPSVPENLHAISHDDHSVSLTWSNTDFAARDFQYERTPEDGNPELILAPDSPTGATDSFDRSQEGVTFIYRVQALLEGAPPPTSRTLRSRPRSCPQPRWPCAPLR